VTTHPRVISLVPSVTESLLAWGVTPVACTRFCEQPALAHVGGTKDPDVGAIARLGPDLVVVDREENRREDHDALVAAGLDVEVLHVAALGDVATEVGRLAERVGVVFDPPQLGEPRPLTSTAFVPIWKRPWMSIGAHTYGASVLRHLGVAVAFSDRAEAYPTLEDDEIVAAGVDMVLAPTEPYPFTVRHRSELERFGLVVFVDGQDLFWWGTRTSAALQRLGTVVGGNVFGERGVEDDN